MDRITQTDIDLAVRRYMVALNSLGITKPGWTITYIKGSKTYGNSFKLVWREDTSGGLSPAPGVDFGGFIGWTTREAYTAIQNMARTMEDVAFWKYGQEI